MRRRNYLALAMIGSISVFCWQATQGAKPKDEMLELYGLFVDAVEKVEVNYVRPVSRRQLLESALEGMLQNLDPHSTFINTSQWMQFRRQIEGRFGGIGIQVGIDNESGRLRVIAPMVGTPAYEGGILAGDQIVEIDGQTAEGMSPDKAIEVLTGRPGTEVKLSVLHEGSEEPEPITITRAIIDVPSVLGDHRKPDDQWEFMLDKDKKIGYIRITSFIQNTADELKKALDELKEEGMKGLDPRPPRRSRRVAECGGRGLRHFPRQRRDRQHQGTEHAAQGLQGSQEQLLRKRADGRAGQPELGVSLRDRLGGTPGPSSRNGRRPAVLREGLGPEHLRARRRQQRAQAHGGQLLSPLGGEHPPIQEREDHGQVGRQSG